MCTRTALAASESGRNDRDIRRRVHKPPNTFELEYRRRFNAADGYVYVLKSGPYYKIGRTRDPERRISWIKLQRPQPVESIYLFLCAHMAEVEAYCHRIFKDKNTNGEWFELDDLIS